MALRLAQGIRAQYRSAPTTTGRARHADGAADGFFAETGVHWDSGRGVHRQRVVAPERTGLYYFHAKGESGAFFLSLVVAPDRPRSPIAVLASTLNTWNAYNAFGGRSNYIMASRMIDTPIVNSKSDLPRDNS